MEGIVTLFTRNVFIVISVHIPETVNESKVIGDVGLCIPL